MSTIPQADIDYQKSHPNETSTGGLADLLIVGFVVCQTGVLLRMWTRRLQKVPLQADDYTLIAAAVSLEHCKWHYDAYTDPMYLDSADIYGQLGSNCRLHHNYLTGAIARVWTSYFGNLST